MFSKRSTNNWAGWFHYYIAHLISFCGVDRESAVYEAIRHSNEAFRSVHSGNGFKDLTDNQIVMVSNRWHYRLEYGLLTIRENCSAGVFINWENVAYWQSTM